MFDKRVWPNITYAVILFILCVTMWQLTTYPEPLSPVDTFTPYSFNTSYAYPIHALPTNDYQQLIDLSNFTFTIRNLPCNDSAPTLLILIHSDPKKFATRSILRETWAKSTPHVKVLFATGSVDDVAVKTQLYKENEEYGDLIQGSFYDAYRNMTYKHVMVLKYAIYHCPQAKYILKTDDDVFVNMPSMMNFLNVYFSPYGGSRMLLCIILQNSKVIRSWRSKWRVSFKEYPAKTYPTYCFGWAILYSPDVVFELYREAQRTDYFWIDDVHITGTLAAKIHLGHVNVDNLVLTSKDMKNFLQEPVKFNQSFLYGPPNLAGKQIKALWRQVNNHDVVSLSLT